MNLVAIKIEAKVFSLICLSPGYSVLFPLAKMDWMPKGNKLNESTVGCKQGIDRIHAN